MAKLELRVLSWAGRPENIGRLVRFRGPEFSLNQQLIGDRSVSRTHAEIRERDSEFVLVDLESSNGTYLNFTPVNPGEEPILKPGDRVGLANVRTFDSVVVIDGDDGSDSDTGS